MRMTRAALRAQAQEEPQLIYEDADATANTSLQDDCADADPDADANQDLVRPPLKDITTEINPSTTQDPFTDPPIEPMQKAKSRRKARKAKHDNVGAESSHGESDRSQEPQPEDANDSHHSESAEDKGEIQGTPSAVSVDQRAVQMTEVTVEAVDATLEEQGMAESTSTPQRCHAGAPKTPKFDPSVHQTMEEAASSASDTVEDSFVEKITSRTPGRLQTLLEGSKSPDSSADQMSSRTPRIEDSVEAIDALEDAIEKVAETLPALDELKIESPVKPRKNTPARVNLEPTKPPTDPQKKATGRQPGQPSRRLPPKAATTSGASERPKLAAGRGSSTNLTAKAPTAAKPARRPIPDGHKSRESAGQGAAPPLSFSNSPVKNLPNTGKKPLANGALSTSKPGFVPAKSNKSPTKPKFSLPGDAVAAKLKAQREERMKREEEASNEKKTFKARPVPAKISRPSVVPRENKASQARMSIYATGRNKENVEPKPAAATQPKPRPSSLGSKTKASETTTNAKASVRRTTTSATSATPAKPRASIMHLATGQKSTVTKEDVVQQKAKGKEVFARSKAETERLEKERRDKEDAARKARAEAAERGRQASREWAEKQKKRIAAKVLAAKEKAKAEAGGDAPGQTGTVVST